MALALPHSWTLWYIYWTLALRLRRVALSPTDAIYHLQQLEVQHGASASVFMGGQWVTNGWLHHKSWMEMNGICFKFLQLTPQIRFCSHRQPSAPSPALTRQGLCLIKLDLTLLANQRTKRSWMALSNRFKQYLNSWEFGLSRTQQRKSVDKLHVVQIFLLARRTMSLWLQSKAAFEAWTSSRTYAVRILKTGTCYLKGIPFAWSSAQQFWQTQLSCITRIHILWNRLDSFCFSQYFLQCCPLAEIPANRLKPSSSSCNVFLHPATMLLKTNQ